MATSTQQKLLMIPGPIEYAPEVLNVLGQQSMSHTAPAFIAEFADALALFRQVMRTHDGQPFILSGSGTLGWDIVCCNLMEPGDRVLVLNTGYFSNAWRDCANAYAVHTEEIKAPHVGDTISVEAVRTMLTSGKPYKAVFITQVDTSTSVLNDVKALADVVRDACPDTLICVDGVCSFGAERMEFDRWGIDYGMSCSQKALGAPPGLSLLMLSQRALSKLNKRTTPIQNYFGNLKNWLPIMKAYENKTPSYFATPAVNLIRAIRVSLHQLVSFGMDNIFEKHIATNRKIKAAIAAMGLKIVPTSLHHAANTLTAIYFPPGLDRAKFLPLVADNGSILAAGLLAEIKTEYFRFGHMGYSVYGPRDDIKKTLSAIESALNAAGYNVASGTAAKAFEEA